MIVKIIEETSEIAAEYIIDETETTTTPVLAAQDQVGELTASPQDPRSSPEPGSYPWPSPSTAFAKSGWTPYDPGSGSVGVPQPLQASIASPVEVETLGDKSITSGSSPNAYFHDGRIDVESAVASVGHSLDTVRLSAGQLDAPGSHCLLPLQDIEEARLLRHFVQNLAPWVIGLYNMHVLDPIKVLIDGPA